MNKALSLLVQTTMVSSLLILIIFVLRYVFKNRINTKLQYALWLIVAVRLLIPFNYQWTIETKYTIPQIKILDFGLENRGDIQSNYDYQPPVNRETDSITKSPSKQITAHKYNLSKILFVIWITGAVSILAVLVIRNISCYKKTMKNIRPYDFLDNTYNEAAKAVGINHRIPVYLSQSFKSPLLVGILHPVIVLTEAVIHDPEATKLALVHEMIHYKQRDNLIRLIGNILCSVYWFNPLVWLSAEAARNDAELSCDSRVLQKISSREHYSYCLALLSAAGGSPQVAAAMSTGGARMKKRIDMIIKPPKSRAVAIIAAVICLCLGTASFINVNAKTQLLPGSISEWNFDNTTSLGNIYEVYQILTSLPNPNDNYKINTTIIGNEDQLKNLYVGYEFVKRDSIGGLDEDDIKRINANALRLFFSIPDLNSIKISYFDKEANSITPNVKAPISFSYQRSQIFGREDLPTNGANIEGFNITPRIDNNFEQSMGANNVILVYGHCGIFSKIGIEKYEHRKDSATLRKILSILGDYKDTWKSPNSTMYRYSPNPVYPGWSDLMIMADELGNFQGLGILLFDPSDW